jgi:hypothetical protein
MIAAAACLHRGDELALIECPNCTGTVQLKKFACAVHAECTVARPIVGIACCVRCPDFVSSV